MAAPVIIGTIEVDQETTRRVNKVAVVVGQDVADREVQLAEKIARNTEFNE